MGFHKRGDEESSVHEEVAEKPLELHDRERKMTSCTEPEYTCSLFVA